MLRCAALSRWRVRPRQCRARWWQEFEEEERGVTGNAATDWIKNKAALAVRRALAGVVALLTLVCRRTRWGKRWPRSACGAVCATRRRRLCSSPISARSTRCACLSCSLLFPRAAYARALPQQELEIDKELRVLAVSTQDEQLADMASDLGAGACALAVRNMMICAAALSARTQCSVGVLCPTIASCAWMR